MSEWGWQGKAPNNTANATYLYANTSTKAANPGNTNIIRDILQNLDELLNQRPNLEFKIDRVPGHMNIDRNAKPDEEGKEQPWKSQWEDKPAPPSPLKRS